MTDPAYTDMAIRALLLEVRLRAVLAERDHYKTIAERYLAKRRAYDAERRQKAIVR